MRKSMVGMAILLVLSVGLAFLLKEREPAHPRNLQYVLMLESQLQQTAVLLPSVRARIDRVIMMGTEVSNVLEATQQELAGCRSLIHSQGDTL